MGNRVYLYCTDFEGLPTEEQADEFFTMIGTEYEATARLPLFWMCLFSGDDIHVTSGPAAEGEHSGKQGSEGAEDDDEYDDEECDEEADQDAPRPFAYLGCERLAGIARLRQRSAMLRPVLGEERHALYEDWIARLEAEPRRNIVVNTEELDGMSDDGQLEQQLRAAYQELAVMDERQAWQMSPLLHDLTGLYEEQAISEVASWTLAGSANDATRWPPELTQPQQSELPAGATAALPAPSPWWMFWKR
ncbi:hypothetical protein [Herbaspirillum huttiense]|uniref:hypothetical protein n=1 Tax=Herbaspirillum huttiense TaxID=863372 RepID=UPI0004019AFA|nr:hypothetical protein [Herbaspirillum huttiense]MBN9357366.1 hypothetical protein [Herbaspirillum huttiense]